MEEKQYFEKLNEYYVKDGEARESINTINETIGDNDSGLIKEIHDIETVIGDENSGIIKDINDLEIDVEDLSNKVDLIEGNDTIFLGDSYSDGTTYEGGSLDHVNSWAENLRNLMGLTDGHYYIFSQGGGGFSHQAPNGKRFIDLIQDNADSVTHKNKIKNIIVCAGYNDNDQTYNDIYTRVGQFVTYCKEEFPNAKCYLGMIGGDSNDTTSGASIRNNLTSKVLKAFLDAEDFGWIYLSGVENFSHNFKMFDPQGNHPTEDGYKLLGRMIYDALESGYANMYQAFESINLDLIDNASTVSLTGGIHNNNKTLSMGNIILDDVTINVESSEVTLVDSNTDNYLCKPSISKFLDIPCDIWYKDNTDNNHFATGKLQFKDDGSIIVNSTYFAINGGIIKQMAIYPVIVTVETLIS